jgi:hypothetical protein
MIACSFSSNIYQINSHNYAQVIIFVERSTECLLEDLHHHLIQLWPQSLQDQEEEQEDITGEIRFIWNTCQSFAEAAH